MRRNHSMWAFYLTMILGAALSLALLPACGGGGGGNSDCNDPDTIAALDSDDGAVQEAAEADCEVEEGEEEFEIQALDDALNSDRYETQGPDASEVFFEVYFCGSEVPCDEE